MHFSMFSSISADWKICFISVYLRPCTAPRRVMPITQTQNSNIVFGNDCIGKHMISLIKPLRRKHKRHEKVSTIYIIPQHWYDTGSWNPSSCGTWTYLSYMVNTMGAGGMGPCVARTSSTMILSSNNDINYVEPEKMQSTHAKC